MTEAQGELAERFMTVGVAGQSFGLRVGDVQDVFEPREITRVPLAPGAVAGVLNLRGRIVTVIDVRERLGLARRAEGKAAMAVGIERGGESYGLLIDEVGDVVSLGAAKAEAVPETVDANWRAVSTGVYHLQDILVLVLDVDRLIGAGASPNRV